MEDHYRHKGMRTRMVEEIRLKGISDERVLAAIEKIPRHFFMESSFEKFAYKDQAFPISSGQTISQPYTVAFQTQLLDIQKGDKILEIGTGSGYQTAMLLEMEAVVYTIERQQELFIRAKNLLNRMGYRPHFVFGDGYKGLPAFVPFDKILITAGAPFIPAELIAQLKIGGRLVAPVGETNLQRMTCIVRTGEESLEKTEHGNFIFVPLIEGLAYD
jgi:protein-L-isoaspartate(D-aspartate) O-methyltransferase